jgi:tetratricopeptide (TPR) repeat protein
MQAFIIRPFGRKKDIDFERVEAELIGPALESHGIVGRTTADSLKQGNIRTEMFHRLLTADVVIVDVSIHNANVFYELGIRHALREKRTFLIRCAGNDLPPDEVPFDIRTDRYLSYDPSNPSSMKDRLIEGLRQTLRSEDRDSPVFQQLPSLQEQDPSRFLVIPAGFRDEIDVAFASQRAGDLDLLATEARGFRWEVGGLRLVGRAQYKLKAFRAARATWEAIRETHSDDLEADTLLGTIYQRLDDLSRSDIALKRVLEREGTSPEDRAEALSLLARNAKARWKGDWEKLPVEQRRPRALRSGFLEDAINLYADAFRENLNHFFSGLNALAMSTVEVELAVALPEVWSERFDDSDTPRELDARRRQIAELSAAVALSVRAALERAKRIRKPDLWAKISEADLCLLTTKRPERARTAYEKALAGADAFAIDSARGQIELYRELGVLTANVEAALAAFPPTVVRGTPRVLLFTGHRIDDPGRHKPRFPADKEDVARNAIRDAVLRERQAGETVALGIAGGASGGDILFHEVCAELGIRTDLYLALPPDEFVAASVRSAGPQWIERFRQVRAHAAEERILSNTDKLPAWLEDKRDYSIWQRNNLWELYNALAASDHVTVIALWNGERGDGPGGTADLVEKAAARGAKSVILDTKKLFAD